MKKIITSFNDFLNEKVILPDTDFVFKELYKNKSKILKANSIKNLDKIFNDIFNKYWILINFDSSLKDEECLVPEWSIDTANTVKNSKAPDGSIVTLVFTKNILDKLKQIKDNTEWEFFVKRFEYVITHEFVHKIQLKNIPDISMKKIWGGKLSDKEYLSIKHEIMAFAIQCVKEFMIKGYSPDDILSKIKNPNKSSVKDEDSDIWRTYKYFFKPEDKEFKKFTKNIYEYCMIFKKRYYSPTFEQFLFEDVATNIDDMNNLLQHINKAADKRIKTIDNQYVAKVKGAPGKDDSVINISIQNTAYLDTGTYAVSDLKKGVNISQKDWQKWSDSKISKYIQQWLNSLKTGQE